MLPDWVWIGGTVVFAIFVFGTTEYIIASKDIRSKLEEKTADNSPKTPF